MTKITGKDNPRIISAGKLRQKKYRDETCRFIISGKKLAVEAQAAGIVIDEVFFSESFMRSGADTVSTLTDAYPRASFYEISDGLCRKLTDEDSPEGVFCVCEKPDAAPRGAGGFVLVCDRISDPGNIGTVLRSARAFRARVILSADCADPYSPKVLRAAMGAVFCGNISFTRDVKSTVSELKSDGYTVYAAALHKKAVRLSEADLSGRCAVLIGNEGSGLSDDTVAVCDAALLVEMEPGCESLNAAIAASVIMYRAYKND